MRDYILLFINGREHRVRGTDAFLPVTDYLRYKVSVCGTKVVCAEGDCGACTLMLGRQTSDSKLGYVPVNGCIQYVFQLDCCHVVTVEGLRNGEELNPVQCAMVDNHGAQCGYCTPGFIVAMCALFDGRDRPIERKDVKDALSGNLCRCTGYVSIIDSALAVDSSKFIALDEQYPCDQMIKTFEEHSHIAPLIEADGRSIFCPFELEGALEYRKKYPDVAIVSGGTDVCVNMNKRGFQPSRLLSLGNVSGLSDIEHNGNILVVGARVPLRSLEQKIKELIPELYKILFVFGSPQIRWAGTLAGNIANASPISDTGPFLFVMDAEIEVQGSRGSRRIKMQQLYKGYKQLAMEPDEIITRVYVPIPEKDELLRLYKVSRREHLDISSFTAAIRMRKENGCVVSPVVSVGGVAAVVMRLKQTEEFLEGRAFTLETFQQAGDVARNEISPISDVRGTKDFRNQLAENIFSKFFYEIQAAERQPVCL